MKHFKIIIAGGTGFIGQSLVKYFGKTNQIVILCRSKNMDNCYPKNWLSKNDGFDVRYVKWDGQTVDESWSKELDGADLIINLAGKSVNCRYHKRQKKEILDSRLLSTKAIGRAIRLCQVAPRVWINAASATIYKNSFHPNDEFTGRISEWKEDNMPYNLIDHLRQSKNRLAARIFHGTNSSVFQETKTDFSIRVCKSWEKTFFEEPASATRKIALRMAITLGNGGVIIPFLNLCKYGLGGKQGSGKQMFSWVHVEDVARMIEWIFLNKSAAGVYNCAAPGVVSNSCFMKTLRKVTGHTRGLSAPAFLLELGAFLIGTETELILKSRYVAAKKSINEGFEFKFTLLEEALKDIIAELPHYQNRLF